MTLEIPANPYAILAVPRTASRAEIAAAMAQALKERKHPPTAIAEAQRTLMNPEKRAFADFLLPSLPLVQRWKPFDLSELASAPETWTPLAEYDDLAGTIAAIEERLRHD